jgi:hypothetical protein
MFAATATPRAFVAPSSPNFRRGKGRAARVCQASKSNNEDVAVAPPPSSSSPSLSRRAALFQASGTAAAAAVVGVTTTVSGLWLPPQAAAASATSAVTLAKLTSASDASARLAKAAKASASFALPPGEKLTPAGGGALHLSPLGIGTWSWGNQFVWGYSEVGLRS